jgi:hypothetical protein
MIVCASAETAQISERIEKTRRFIVLRIPDGCIDRARLLMTLPGWIGLTDQPILCEQMM